MATAKDFIDAEVKHSAVLAAGYPKNASPEAKAALAEAKKSRAAELGDKCSPAKAGVKLISPNGELQMSVTKNEVADARAILEGKPTTWDKDNKRDGRDVKAGDPREPNETSKFLALNVGQMVNNQTNKSGLDAINFKTQGPYAVAYMKVDGIQGTYDQIRDVTNHTRGTTCVVQKTARDKAAAASKDKGAEIGG